MEMKNKSISKESAVCGLQSAVSRSGVAASGFTLIELLVAMGILMVIVLMLANLFQQSTRSWDAGMRQAEIGLEARAAINIITHDLNQAVCPTNEVFDPYSFYILSSNPTNGSALELVTYSGGSTVRRNNNTDLVGDIVPGSFSIEPVGTIPPAGQLPDLVEIKMELSSQRDYSVVRVYAEGYENDGNNRDYVDTGRPE